MKINVYLPDEIGNRADAAGLKGSYSGLLRSAVEDELTRLEAQQSLSDDSETIMLLDLIDKNGRKYRGRFYGKLIGRYNHKQIIGKDRFHVYLSEPEDDDIEILVHDTSEKTIKVIEIADAEDLSDWLRQEDYIEVMYALGETPIVDI